MKDPTAKPKKKIKDWVANFKINKSMLYFTKIIQVFGLVGTNPNKAVFRVTMGWDLSHGKLCLLGHLPLNKQSKQIGSANTNLFLIQIPT
jgi:hypothetical protein